MSDINVIPNRKLGISEIDFNLKDRTLAFNIITPDGKSPFLNSDWLFKIESKMPILVEPLADFKQLVMRILG
jgi:hypothetical protein